jgi:hypothetical protein
MKSRKLGQQFAQSLLSDRAASSHRRERQVTHSRIESDILLIEYQTIRTAASAQSTSTMVTLRGTPSKHERRRHEDC